MKIGYPCINRSIGCSSGRTFRLRSYSEEKLRGSIEANLACLELMIEFNDKAGLGFLRISSGIVPFASHPVCTFKWQRLYAKRLASIGRRIKRAGMRISMHPDQFVLVNALEERIFESSLRELVYHCELLDSMELSRSAKIQIHIGGLYGDREKSLARFSGRFAGLPEAVKKRLAIENDDRLFGLADCMRLHGATGVPVIFDSFHHALKNDGEPLSEALALAASTWRARDGLPMVDYSSQKSGARPGSHAESIDPADFREFLKSTEPADFDLMLEIKDKERSAAKAVLIASSDARLLRTNGFEGATQPLTGTRRGK